MPTVLGKHRAKTAELFHALADETRLEILSRLKDGERCVCELTNALQTGQSRLSFHLKVLKDVGLIHDRPEGRWMYYALNPAAFNDVEELVRTFKRAAQLAHSSSGCC